MKSNRRHLPISLSSATNQRNPVRVDHPQWTGFRWRFSQFNTMEFPRRATVGQARPLKAWSTKGFWCDRRFCLGILFSHKDLCIYIHYTVRNYKMCMCTVYYRYMVCIDDRSQRSSRLSLLEVSKKFPWNTWSSPGMRLKPSKGTAFAGYDTLQ